MREWGGKDDLWIFAYASLIWRPEFEHAEERFATIHGYHRALKMWSRVNRGTPECPGLVFGLLHGGSCKGMVCACVSSGKAPSAKPPAVVTLRKLRRLTVFVVIEAPART